MAVPYQILVVDDDFSIVNIIETALKQTGYQVLTAHDGEAACQIVNTRHPHLIIMDVMMPSATVFSPPCAFVRTNNVPILMLSAKAEGSDRVLGLEAGADDYLVKPFYQQELLARVKALLRRYDDLGSIRETKSEDQIQVGDIILDTAAKQLLVPGRRGSSHRHGVQNSAGTDGKSGPGILRGGNLRTGMGNGCLRCRKHRHGSYQPHPGKAGAESKKNRNI